VLHEQESGELKTGSAHLFGGSPQHLRDAFVHNTHAPVTSLAIDSVNDEDTRDCAGCHAAKIHRHRKLSFLGNCLICSLNEG
jgi:hypothetical protein